MADMFKSMGSKLTASADTASRAIKAQAFKAEIMMKEQQVKSVKQEFGVTVYASLESADQAETSRIFGEYSAKVNAINAEIAAKRLDIAEMEKAGQH
jgi:hypothetical protein